jgi:hypothetical protein
VWFGFCRRSAGPARRFAACHAGAAFLCCRRDEKNKAAETSDETKVKLAIERPGDKRGKTSQTNIRNLFMRFFYGHGELV